MAASACMRIYTQHASRKQATDLSLTADMKLVFLAIIVFVAVVVTASMEPRKRVARSHWGVMKAAKAAKMDYLRRHLHHGKPLIFAHKIHSSPHHQCSYCKLHKRKGLKPGKVIYYD